MLRLLRFAFPALILTACTFVLHAQPSRRQASRTAAPNERPVAIVNGKEIPYRRYADMLGDQINYQLRTGLPGIVDQATDDLMLMQLIEGELIRQECARRGITVTRNNAVQALLKDPPEFIRGPFVDETGKFRDDAFRQMVLKPETMGRIAAPGVNRDTVIARWKADLEKVIVFVQNQELKRLLTDKLYGARPLKPSDIRARYFAERTRFTGSFLRILHSTYPDSLVPVTEEEAQAWYKSHLEDYRFAAARQLASIIIPVVPSAADSAVRRANIEAARDVVLNAPRAQRAAAVEEVSRALPPNRMPATPINLLQVPEGARDSLRRAKPGDLIGPFTVNDEEILIFVEDTATVADTLLRARHVLMKTDIIDTAEIRATHDMLVALKEKATTEEVFLQVVKFYSQDKSVEREGDLGFFGRGGTVKEFEEAAFNGPIGQTIGPIRSRFGFHLIWVNERVTTGYRIRELRFPIRSSQAAVDSARRNAEAYADLMRAGKANDSTFRELRAKYPRLVHDTSVVRRLEMYGDALAAVNFGFSPDSKVGDVATFPLPYDRVMIARVIFAYPTDVAPYENIRTNFVYPHVRRAKQLELLKPSVYALRDTVTADMLLGIIRLKTPWAESFMMQNQLLTSPPDEDTTLIDSLVEITPENGVTGPVRGKHGYYFLRIIKRHVTPTAADYAREQATFTREYTARYRSGLLAELVTKLRDYADVKDLRTSAASTAGIVRGGSMGGGGN